jgi:hypothetical protein
VVAFKRLLLPKAAGWRIGIGGGGGGGRAKRDLKEEILSGGGGLFYT